MKTRLLMLLSVFMAITSVGWMQAQSITYYKTGSGSGGTGTEQDPIVKISLDEILGDANAKLNQTVLWLVYRMETILLHPELSRLQNPGLVLLGLILIKLS